MTFAKIWIQIKTKWEEIHQKAEENIGLCKRVAHLESMLQAHNLDPNVDIDSRKSES